MARARQYDSVCTAKGGREERECARHWIMQGEKVDRGNREGWASGRESPFMSSSAIQRQQASASTPYWYYQPVLVHVHTPSKPHPKCSNILDVATFSSHTWEESLLCFSSLRREEANDFLKDSFFKMFAALYFSLFAHVLSTGCWH